ncbi:MAG: Uncharacterised protein [Synechococcus sp. MIT S9220]|nr:MAG: Uncharacterised protein [Synechococcus sp. MIT S9220]
MAGLALMLCLVSARCGTGVMPQPQPGDPSLFIPRDGTSLAVRLVGRIHADGAVTNGRCLSLLDVSSLNGQFSRGRTELTIDPCTTPLLTGSWLELEGELRRPQPGSHPLLARGDERLALQRTWSRLRTDAMHVLRQDWTPLADARRTIAERFADLAGEQSGGLLAALVLGAAQVPCRKACARDFGWLAYRTLWRRRDFISPCCWAAHSLAPGPCLRPCGLQPGVEPWRCFSFLRARSHPWCARC